MKRILTLVLIAAALSVPAAQAATPKGPTLAQFNALKAQLAKDEKRIKQLELAADGTLFLIACQNAVTADAVQGTWQSIDALATSLGRPAIFGPQTPISDAGGCPGFKITRSQAVPPNVSVFSALAALLSL